MKEKFAIVAILALTALPACGKEEAKSEYNPVQVIKRPFPAIKDPQLLEASEADSMRDDELVLALGIGDEYRAYPINMLTGPRREIINDTLGGRPIAATW